MCAADVATDGFPFPLHDSPHARYAATMTLTLFKQSVRSQFTAALDMLEDFVRKCPDAAWDEPVAKYPFWMVAYHTLCFADLYLAPSNRAWKPDKGKRGEPGLHPKGRQELADEYPSRKFAREEILRYVEIVRVKLDAALDCETAKSLAGPSGFSWIRPARVDTYLYNLRHVCHHVGQLSAFLHKRDISARWVKFHLEAPTKAKSS